MVFSLKNNPLPHIKAFITPSCEVRLRQHCWLAVPEKCQSDCVCICGSLLATGKKAPVSEWKVPRSVPKCFTLSGVRLGPVAPVQLSTTRLHDIPGGREVANLLLLSHLEVVRLLVFAPVWSCVLLKVRMIVTNQRGL